MTLMLRAAAVTDLGLVRSNNEDAVFAGRRLLAVADGIGGAPAGELASEIVIRALAELDEGPEPAAPLTALSNAIRVANQQIGESTAGDLSPHGTGATVTPPPLPRAPVPLRHVRHPRGYLP